MRNQSPVSAYDRASNPGAMTRYFPADSTGGSIVAQQPVSYLIARTWGLVSSGPWQSVVLSTTSGEVVEYEKLSTALVPIRPAIQTAFVAVPSAPVATAPASVLDRVRDAFGLNVSETADLFRVTRQTVYQWMKLADMEQVRSHADRERIKTLYRAAQLWQAQPRLTGRWLRAILPSGVTVLDLLMAHQIDFWALQAAYVTLAASTKERRKDEGERAAKAAAALAGALGGLGSGRKTRKETR